jgi:hypothetical protein
MKGSWWGFLSVCYLLGAALGFGQPAAAAPPRDEYLLRRLGIMRVGLEVVVDGKPIPTVEYEGKIYLPVSRLGAEYAIRVFNHGPRRIAAVVSVDGLSVIDGRPASESSPAYLVDAHSSILIKGWRRNLDTVAAFSFVDREKSYASRTGRPENVGVIGLVAIEEQGWRHPSTFEMKDKARPSAGLSNARARVGGIGTEYGREVDSRAAYVPFVRSANKRTITLYYDTVGALRKAGVPVDEPLPVPFPNSNGMDIEFAPPPPGYSGGK